MTLEETDRLFTCEFCRVKSYLLEQGHFQYMLPHNAADEERLFYVPYWRFKGMIFAVGPSGINERFVDLSHQAIGSHHVPVSMGLRSQALKLKFVTPEQPGIFLEPIQSSENIMALFDKRFKKELPKPILHMDHIGESLSLIYSPHYLKERKLFDAVLNQPVATNLPDDFDPDNFNGGPAGAHLKFLPTLCPECGWDLGGQRDSLSLHCKNCKSVWHPRNSRLKKTGTAHMPSSRSSEVIYLPFWRIRADITGIKLTSYADLVRIANLPKPVQSEWESIPFRFWGPAFKVRPQRYLKLAVGITISQPTRKLKRGMPKSDQLVSVNLPLREALETLKLNLADLIRPRRRMVDSIEAIRIEPRSFLLTYLPFEVGPHDYVQPEINLAINKNQLQLSKNL